MTRPIPYPLRQEWLITDEGADLVVSVWETAHATGKAERIALALEARDGQPFKNERNCVVDNGIAVMSIDGPLMRKAELFSDISGATSYQWIGATCDKLRADPAVEKVIIRFTSPGGEAAGVGECGEKIKALSDKKYTEAYVETQCASAAIWLAVQCRTMTAHPTAQVGWIGAIRMLTDDSKRDEMQGIREIEIVSKGAEKKRTQPMNDAVIARVQRGVDEWGRLFTSAIADGRGVTSAKVLKDFGGGDGMFAEAALEVGLIDRIGNFESVMARLTASTSFDLMNKGASMSKPDGVRMSDADNEWKCTGCKEMMGPSATKYCAKCAAPDDGDGDDDDDDDGDEDEAKALRLDASASRGARMARIVALVELEQKVLAATGETSHERALAALAGGIAARGEIAKVEAAGRKVQLRALLERGLAGAPGKQATLSLGRIQREMPAALRGETKKAWRKAMEQLSVDADEAAKANPKAEGATLTAEQIITAACSVTLSADDLESLSDFVASSSPVAAANFVEPGRDGDKEGAEVNAVYARIDKAAEDARRVLDRNSK